jgi:hypothetical protein
LRFHLTRVSRNMKTGPIPVSTSSRDICPDSCSLKKSGCYAERGPIALHWNKVTKTGVSFVEFLKQVSDLPRRQLWRYGQAGDLPPDPEDVKKLAVANGRRPAIVFTHRRDIEAYKEVEALGLHINLSADNLSEADTLAKTGLSVVVVLSSFFHKKKDETLREYRSRIGGHMSLETPEGRTVAICPATYYDTDCSRCQACARRRPGGTIIGFPAHGSGAKRVDLRVGEASSVRAPGNPTPWEPHPRPVGTLGHGDYG